ncbi:FkbM family methyltransferase [Hymenobacter sp. H14-R3]|uniref:FkbM family methyltransferase n=1 Tax=Hymenobacter sp. H14-R3 TaxID=3046308 RepID=UPI0024B8B54A|nr:FkbM family methyltransferase [Hymenobacter sp. H14-R3]MDJ0364152.1 FkbM family methyltransferase [Hymenobacter sp. H14-R3]
MLPHSSLLTSDLLQRLRRVEKLAALPKIGRLLRLRGRYIYALGFRLLRYRRTKKGVARQALTFFNMPMTVVLPASTDIYLTGGKSHDSEIRLARFLIQHLTPGAVFADVGAHFGYFSLLAAQLVGAAGQVVAFEASTATYAVLAANVAAVPTVAAHHCAISDTQERLSFYEFPVHYNEFNSLDVSQFAEEKWFKNDRPVKIEVAATTLDSVFAAAVCPPAIIKIDVEGAEFKVIKGAAELLRRAAPAVVLEYLEPKRHNTEHRQAAALLADLGYQAHRISSEGLPIACPNVDAYLLAQGIDSDNFVFLKARA